jgi:hypothetical protein
VAPRKAALEPALLEAQLLGAEEQPVEGRRLFEERARAARRARRLDPRVRALELGRDRGLARGTLAVVLVALGLALPRRRARLVKLPLPAGGAGGGG